MAFLFTDIETVALPVERRAFTKPNEGDIIRRDTP